MLSLSATAALQCPDPGSDSGCSRKVSIVPTDDIRWLICLRIILDDAIAIHHAALYQSPDLGLGVVAVPYIFTRH
jgi:hypothetical protein